MMRLAQCSPCIAFPPGSRHRYPCHCHVSAMLSSPAQHARPIPARTARLCQQGHHPGCESPQTSEEGLFSRHWGWFDSARKARGGSRSPELQPPHLGPRLNRPRQSCRRERMGTPPHCDERVQHRRAPQRGLGTRSSARMQLLFWPKPGPTPGTPRPPHRVTYHRIQSQICRQRCLF